jgi:dynein heavy chain
MSVAAELELGDTRVEFMADYVLKTLKFKGDKWTKMYSLDENKQMFFDFFEKQELSNFVICSTPSGGLTVQFDWPTSLKSKGCYFIKKGKDPVTKDHPLRNTVLYGDLSYSPMEQLSAFVDEVIKDKEGGSGCIARVSPRTGRRRLWPMGLEKILLDYSFDFGSRSRILVE